MRPSESFATSFGVSRWRHASASGPVDVELAHVRDVEEADPLADGPVLLEDAGVLDRHLPAAEVDQLRAELAVQVVEGRAAQRGLWSGDRHRQRKLAQGGGGIRDASGSPRRSSRIAATDPMTPHPTVGARSPARRRRAR